jgi:hypothetical protein
MSKRQRVALGAHAPVEATSRRTLHTTRGRRTPAAQAGQRVQRGAVGGRLRPALHLAQAVGEEAQRPLRGHAGSSWRTAPAAALRGLTKVFSPFSRWRSLSALEVVAAHVDLAAHLQHRRRVAAQAQRDLADGADVLRHVLAGLAVAARGGLHQHAVLVAQVDGQAVELELGGVFDRRRVGASPVRGARARRRPAAPAGGGVGLGADAEHRHAWRTGAKPSSTWPSTRCVGESGVRSSGCAASSACSSWNRRSYSASGISGASST